MKISGKSSGTFTSFTQQVSVFKELFKYGSITEDAIREFIGFLQTSQGGAAFFSDLAQINGTLGSMLNCLGQGFFSFTADGKCSKIASKACQSLLESDPVGRMVWDVLKLDAEKTGRFKTWMQLAFEESVDFESVAQLGIPRFAHSQNRSVLLNYFAIRAKDGKLSEIMVVATDHTETELARHQAEIERKNLEMINKMVTQRKPFFNFVTSLREKIIDFKDLSRENITDMKTVTQEFLRMLHTVKGNALMFAIDPLASFAHELEEDWRVHGQSDLADPTRSLELIRKQTHALSEKLENFLEKHRAILGETIVRKERILELPVSRINNLKVKLNRMQVPRPVLLEVLELAKEPIGPYLAPYTKIAEQIAANQGKQIKPITIRNSEVGIYPEPFRELLASFVHFFRNAIDHGIETPEERKAAGKDPQATLEVNVEQIQEGDHKWFRFAIQDDGRGIDPAEIREVLKSRSSHPKIASKTDEEILQMIFEPKFSTRSQANQISGRGIGLDAIKSSVEKLGGKVRVDSRKGEGTCFTILVPDHTYGDAGLFSSEPESHPPLKLVRA